MDSMSDPCRMSPVITKLSQLVSTKLLFFESLLEALSHGREWFVATEQEESAMIPLH